MDTTLHTVTDAALPKRRKKNPNRQEDESRAARCGSASRFFGRRRHNALIGKVIDSSTLEAAWTRVRRNAGVAGGDGISCRVFERDAPDRLKRLRRDLRAGRYVPGPVRRVEIVKETGGTRPLAIPCVSDRVLQTAVAFTLTPILEPAMSSASFGYRLGLGVDDAVARIMELRRDNRSWVLESDVARFFETVPHGSLLDLLDERVGDSRLTDLVALWLGQSGTEERGLLQGSPLSPLLANLYLDEVDHLLDGPDGRLVRYADDFIVLSRRKTEAEMAKERAETLLAERGLALHPDKTRISRFEDGFWFLGHYFVRGLVLRDLEHAPEAAPPVWEFDAPSEDSREPRTESRSSRRPALARVSEALRKRLGRRRSAPEGPARDEPARDGLRSPDRQPEEMHATVDSAAPPAAAD